MPFLTKGLSVHHVASPSAPWRVSLAAGPRHTTSRLRARAPSLLGLGLACSVLCAGSFAAPVSPAQAQRGQNPFDREQTALAREAERSGRSPRAALPILRMVSNDDWASPELTTRLLARLASSRALSAPMRAYGGAQHALMLARAGEVDRARQAFDELGFVRHFRIVGPFDNEGKAGFDRELPPELARNAPLDPDAEYVGRERTVRAREYPDITRFGYVDFDAVMRPYINVCGFAETFVRAETARPISLWVGAGGAVKVYFNGEQVLADATYRRPHMERAAVVVPARAGWNRVLIKACVTDAAWGLYFRLAEADGSPPRGLTIDPDGAREASPAVGPTPELPATPEAPLASFERAVAGAPRDGAARFDLARYLAWTSADDPAEGRARDLAEQAAELAPTAERWLFAASLAETRSDRLRMVSAAERLAPRDPKVRIERASLVAVGPDGGRALQMLDGFPADSTAGVLAERLRASFYSDLGLNRAALSSMDALARRMPHSTEVARWRADFLDGLDRREAHLEELRRVVALCYDDFDARKALIADALEREQPEEAQAHLDVMLALTPGRANTLYYVASIYDGMGREADALALYEEAIRLTPEEAQAHAAHGRALLRYAQTGPASAAFQQALSLRPQDVATRRLYERIRPSLRADEAFATPVEQILARRREQSDRPVTVLHDLTVNTMYENGLSASFRQLAFQVHDAEGGRRMAAHSVQFEPGSQWVEVRSARIFRADGSEVESVRTFERSLSNPSYRIYYDLRALVMSLPDLQPGDTVELRYRVEDVASRNAFNDYYADLHFLQGRDPITRLEYVLISPASREIHMNRPPLAGLSHERSVEGATRTDRWVADTIPAIRDEGAMPGLTEVSPYLHVSTYRTWEDVGRWWWGLSRDQLHIDDSLRQTVAELTRDAPDTRTKVARIYGWVIRNTRYVGLEFGIHGFKPYRVTQVVRRGFGDCKDKAALLYVMLEEAGISARIALVRTRHLGGLNDLPASLSAFNHAIAYVPELDLYLDGTAETSGIGELPAGDQGVMALIVGPDGARLTRTPMQPPAVERHERRIAVRLAPDGSAVVEGEEVVGGVAAAGYRSTYQAEGSREERLQSRLATTFPGVRVERHGFSDLDDFEAPVRFDYRVAVPQFAQRSGDVLQVAPSTFGGLARSLARTATREHPLELGTTSSYLEQRTLTLPQGLRVQELPSGGEATSPFGRLTVRYGSNGSQVTVTTELTFLRDRVSQREYPAFRRFIEEVDALLRERVTVGGAR